MNKRGLTKIPEGVLDACHHVRFLTLQENHLTKLPSKIFAENHLLESISISSNRLTSVDPFWFQACANTLNFLDLTDNFFVDFPVKTLPKMQKLTYLYLAQNQIFNFDDGDVIEKFPSLDYFQFQYNQIGCLHHAQLVKYFTRNNVTTVGGDSSKARDSRFMEKLI